VFIGWHTPIEIILLMRLGVALPTKVFFEFPRAVLGIFHIQDLSSPSESNDVILDSDVTLEDCLGSEDDIFEDVVNEACPGGENEGICLHARGESEDDGCFDDGQDAVEAPEVESAFEDTLDEAAVEAEVGPPNPIPLQRSCVMG
jgi:hypothetical protein